MARRPRLAAAGARQRSGRSARARPCPRAISRWATTTAVPAGLRRGRSSEYDAGLRLAPDDADLLAAAALTSRLWATGKTRSGTCAGSGARPPLGRRLARLARALLWLRRYAEAQAALRRGLALAPADLRLLHEKAMVYLAQGDLRGATGDSRAAEGASSRPRPRSPTSAPSTTSTGCSTRRSRAAAPAHARAPSTTTAAAWGLVLAETYDSGGPALARVYADSARLAFEEQLRARPRTPSATCSWAWRWRTWAARPRPIREGRARGRAAADHAGCATAGPTFSTSSPGFTCWSGEPDEGARPARAAAQDPVLSLAGWLQIDPTFAPLRGNPRFERLRGRGPDDRSPMTAR